MRAASVYRRCRNTASAPKSLKAISGSGVCPSSSLACASARSSSRCLRFVVKQRSSIVVDVRTARKQALPGQSSYMARKTKLLHGTVIERRKTTKEKDLLPSMIILRRGDGVESSPTCWPAALPSSSSCLGCCLAWHRPSRKPGILRPSSILAAVVVAEGATASPSRSCYHTRARRKASAQSGNMEGKRRQNSTPELKERRR